MRISDWSSDVCSSDLIGMVHQHFMLADNLTVLENVVLGAEPRKGLRLDRDAARTRIREIGEAYGMAVDPDRLVEELGVGDRQRVEILKVLYRDRKCGGSGESVAESVDLGGRRIMTNKNRQRLEITI